MEYAKSLDDNLFHGDSRVCEKKYDCRKHRHLFSYYYPSIATKMSWASKRKTTRVEDMAYCLLGIFNINMPLLYGEGDKAFIRFQSEIIKHSDDESILAFRIHVGDRRRGYNETHFADCPQDFLESRYINNLLMFPLPNRGLLFVQRPSWIETNRGLELPITWRCRDQKTKIIKIPLDCWQCSAEGPRNMVLHLDVMPAYRQDDAVLSVALVHTDAAQTSDIFFRPVHPYNEYERWQPSKGETRHEGDLSDILGEVAKLTRVIICLKGRIHLGGLSFRP